MYHPLLPVSIDKDDPAVYADLTMLERSPAAKGVRDSMMRYVASELQKRFVLIEKLNWLGKQNVGYRLF